jgi:hypothetical protein
MRIAFDLDDTLIPALHDFPTEQPPRRLLARLLTRVRLRQGATELLRTLIDLHHEIWVYTTSHRTAAHIRRAFSIPGVRLSGVVNGADHARQVLPYRSCSKYPPAFGIDVLVDDLPGVVAEGEQHGFVVIHVEPNDLHWTEHVLTIVRRMHAERDA